MYHPLLRKMVVAAISRINSEMAQKAPFMAEYINTWMQDLSGSLQPADYFTHPLSFPMLLLPWWVEQMCSPELDVSFLTDLTYSTINGYYYIRMIDNAMDGDTSLDLKQLPALNFFHTQFQLAYQPYFSSDHTFWDGFIRIWMHSGEAAFKDANTPDIDRDRFEQVAAQKICAVKIPILAVCYHHGRLDLIQSWYQLVDRLGCWHQLMNDLFDWRKDMEHNTHTFFLSEAERSKEPDESIAAWVIREGFAWGCQVLHAWMAELLTMARNLPNPDLITYLGERERLFVERETQVTAGFQGMVKVLNALQGK